MRSDIFYPIIASVKDQLDFPVHFTQVESHPGFSMWKVTFSTGKVTFSLHYDRFANGVYFASFKADPPGQGMGSKVLDALVSIFRKNKVKLNLKADPYGDSLMNLEELEKFYEKHGFKKQGDLLVAKKDRVSAWGWREPVEKLVRVLQKASDAYYNTGKPVISDQEFDTLVDILRERDPDNPFLQQVGAPVTTGVGKVTLPYFMPSLNKIKTSEELSVFAKSADEFMVSAKLDGNSALLVYGKNGEKRLYRRGTQKEGHEISKILPYLKLPDVKLRNVAIRGELIIPKEHLKTLMAQSANQDSFNLRNFLAGQINRKTVSPEVGYAKFVAYEIVSHQMTPASQFSRLKKLGFETPFNRRVSPALLNYNILVSVYKKLREKKYEVDGLVITRNEAYQRTIQGNPDYSIAFKANLEENIVETMVTGVEWNASKHGYLKPVVLIKPTKLQGVVIKRVSGHNAQYIQQHGIGKQAVIKITRSGEVIPFITDVVTPSKASLPPGNWKWVNSGVDIQLAEITNEVQIQKLVYFFKTIGADYIGAKSVEKLYANGYTHVLDILGMSVTDFSAVFPGVTAKKLHTSLKQAMRDCNLAMLMDASGEFGRGIAAVRLQSLLRKYPDIMDNPIKRIELQQLALSVEGFSDKMATAFVEGFPKFKQFYREVVRLGYTVKKISTQKSGILSQEVITFTGFRDNLLQKLIESHGGEVKESLTRATTLLLIKDDTLTSTKVTTATQRGIPVLTVPAFRAKFNF